MKVVDADSVLEIVHRYGEYIFITDYEKYSNMIGEIVNLEPIDIKESKHEQENTYENLNHFISGTYDY